ncbi:MAG: hypothetical protein U0163_03395 [Gemmatimonadaceae bacterium]
MSGSGPRPFEADQRLAQTLYQLDVSRPFERWTVLARTAGASPAISVADLGLRPGEAYHAFDFWQQRYLGTFVDSLRLAPVDPVGVQVVCIRAPASHPQVLASNRHVSCGGVDLLDVRWSATSSSGRSTVVGNDDYVCFLTEATRLDSGGCIGNSAAARLEGYRDGARRVVLRSQASGVVTWTITYHHEGEHD